MQDYSSILNEIGEYFGRYQKADGSYDLFTNVVNNGNIEPQRIQNVSDLKKEIPFFNGILYTQYNLAGPQPYYGWQRNVISTLESNKDVYVVAPAGGGKTRPLFGYWIINKYLNTNNRNNRVSGSIHNLQADRLLANYSQNDEPILQNWADVISGLFTNRHLDNSPINKLLLITPIRVLAFEQANGLQDVFLDLFLFIKSLYEKYIRKRMMVMNPRISFEDKMNNLTEMSTTVANRGGQQRTGLNVFKLFGMAFKNNRRGFEIVSGSVSDYESYIKKRVKEMICVKTGGGGEDYGKNPETATAIISTYGSAKNFIGNVVNSIGFIVFDEAQNKCAQ